MGTEERLDRFTADAARVAERVALVAASLATAAAFGVLLLGWVVSVLPMSEGRWVPDGALSRMAALFASAAAFLVLAQRRQRAWLVYPGEAALLGAWLVGGAVVGLPPALLLLLAFVELGVSQMLERQPRSLFARPTLHMALLTPLLPLGAALTRGDWDEAGLLILFSSASFYGVACYQTRWKSAGYAAGVLYNLFLWLAWTRIGWRLADAPQLFLIPVGVSAILLAEVNREELGRTTAGFIRMGASLLITVSAAVPVWQLEQVGAWATLLVVSLAGILAGIGLRVQAFLGLGLVGFAFAVLYPLGRAGMEHPLARWLLMLALGVALILFVAMNERRGLVRRLTRCYDAVRRWE